jgi:ParB family chromosome partitioning protein
MTISAENSDLREIDVSRIGRNPENPRILFRQEEMENLLESIRQYGVQVPISVYKDDGRYVLIDGERRWRCCLKLNKKTIPALVQEKPSPLTNLLLMFNIHSLREQWDLLTIAMKLPKVIRLLTIETSLSPNEADLSRKTGLSRGIIRRCKLLMELPEEYKKTILVELQKPKPQQKLTEDFFIEMERSLKTVERAMPDVITNKDSVRRVLIRKYLGETIPNILQFRRVAKIARAENVSADKNVASTVLRRLFEDNKYSIVDAFEDSVSGAYSEKDLIVRIQSLLERLEQFHIDRVDEDVKQKLRLLIEKATRILEATK